MARFHPLTVTDIRHTIRDAVVVTLQPDDPEMFRFTQGQYLTFRKEFEGTELRRNYSICSGVDDGILQVGIKSVDGGAFSNFANQELKIGDRLDAMPPMGNFYSDIRPDGAKAYLGFAGGSGVTPVLSILRTVLTREPHSTFTLVYANQAVHTIMFREELEDLKNRYMERLTVMHVLESGQDIDLFSGRIDQEKCATLFKSWINVSQIDIAFICGPEPMMMAIAAALKSHGLQKDQIKFELFGASQEGMLARKAARAAAQPDAGTTALITLDGTTHSFEMARDQSILEAALGHNIDAPHACRGGVCSTCKAKVIEGEAEMLINHSLEDYEVEAGFVLTCQCYPSSDRLVVNYDQH